MTEIKKDLGSTGKETFSFLPEGFAIIEGKFSGLLHVGGQDRETFLENSGLEIAEYALFGKCTTVTAISCLLNSKPNSLPVSYLGEEKSHATIGTHCQPAIKTFKEAVCYSDNKSGRKDFCSLSNNKLTYAWLPAIESTGDHREGPSILYTELSKEHLEKVEQILQIDPIGLYDFLIQTFFPELLIPLTEEEILMALEEYAALLIRHRGEKIKKRLDMNIEFLQEEKKELINNLVIANKKGNQSSIFSKLSSFFSGDSDEREEENAGTIVSGPPSCNSPEEIDVKIEKLKGEAAKEIFTLKGKLDGSGLFIDKTIADSVLKRRAPCEILESVENLK